MNEILERIKQFYTYKEMSARAFAISIDFSYCTLNNYLLGKRTTIDGELFKKALSTYEELSAEWLLRGEGKMLKAHKKTRKNISSQDASNFKGIISSQQRTIAILTENVNRLESELAILKK